ncbi:MAG: sulfatase-like hydrolase/transferase [Akkermansiaceae bacterium]|jgi:arylsulfatase A-like enzyme|nr:sulfatase-like hydrolase/transferase [Akkermansiaceae bacterium]MDP4721333.1 sulfatase-like hydrolase/transferase [Akkermansiaceae bacterium]MDP4846786.1 sulfatase-like hydrolase/transferase [Akkermansiaceae bacterium]MDP4897123.1 sulfatase-like hydrolase/transferase [Akkermansiaceae bacterium]
MKNLTLLLTALFLSPLSADEAREKPNVLIILADDLGFADVGFNGCKDIPTPHIDAIANTGVKFESGYVTHPYCSPSRAALMAGRYQQRFGHECNPQEATATNNDGIPTSEILLPARLKEAGYTTGLIGKWHLGVADQFKPLNRGFDEFFGFLSGGYDYFGKPPKDGEPIYRGEEPVDSDSITYLTDNFGNEAVDFITRHKAEPWFLFLSFNAPHAPDQATQEYLDRFPDLKGRRKIYAAMVSAMDDAIGDAMANIKATGQEYNTLVFFLSDNGGRTHVADNTPLKGHKGNTYEGGVRVPFVATWPGTIPAGSKFDFPVSSLDIHATALALAGVSMKDTEGVDLMPFVTGKDTNAPHETLFWRVSGGWDYAVLKGSEKLVKPGWTDTPELYDMDSDISEENDQAANRPETLSRLQTLYEKWDEKNIEPLWDDPHKENVAKEREEETGCMPKQ